MKKQKPIRADVKRRVNMLAAKYSFPDWDFDLFHCADLIFENMKATQKGCSAHTYDTSNGILYIDGKPIDRVAVYMGVTCSPAYEYEHIDFGSMAWRG